MCHEIDTQRSDEPRSVTVVVPVFDNADGLRRTVEAVVRQFQESESVELIIVDDGSTDDTPQIVAEMEREHSSVRALRTKNRGPSAARNTGALAGSGSIILFVDANDEPLEGWLRALHSPFHAGAGVAHCAYVGLHDPARNRYRFSLPGCFGIDRDVFEAIDGYDEELAFGENTDLIERAYRYCESHTQLVVFDERELLRINDVSNPRRYDAKRLAAIQHLLQRDAARVADNNMLRARLAGIGAVSAVRVGEPAEARRLAWIAVRARPLRVRHWTRLALILIGPLGRRRWPRGAIS